MAATRKSGTEGTTKKSKAAAPKRAAKPAAKAPPKRAARSGAAATTLSDGGGTALETGLSSPTLPLPPSGGPVTRAEFQELSDTVGVLKRQIERLTGILKPPSPLMNDGSGDSSGSSGSDGSI
ncbi:hypothetical protein [Roseomonas elaeocarpi]|uniref:Uncharacterized protein n=1 Tax=Roseomonas elaeocarpi TaxID=907779 RepID=A0ABV6JRJ6_9PROT